MRRLIAGLGLLMFTFSDVRKGRLFDYQSAEHEELENKHGTFHLLMAWLGGHTDGQST